MQIRTDLAVESGAGTALGGIETSTRTDGPVEEYRVVIHTAEAAGQMGKAPGIYITLSNPGLARAEESDKAAMARALSKALISMLPNDGDVLIVGLGNRRITADALGSRVLESLLVTRHMQEVTQSSARGRLRGVCAVAPGVLGVTGLETAEVVKGIVEHVKPAAVVAIDALAARETSRICTTLQVTDTGIRPGSGVGNHRMGLTKETLGVPVIAIGVPMVVYASVIARDALALLINDLGMKEEDHAQAMDALVDKVTRQTLGDLVVTPREVDDLVGAVAEIIAKGLNLALQPGLTADEIESFAHGKL